MHDTVDKVCQCTDKGDRTRVTVMMDSCDSSVSVYIDGLTFVIVRWEKQTSFDSR